MKKILCYLIIFVSLFLINNIYVSAASCSDYNNAEYMCKQLGCQYGKDSFGKTFCEVYDFSCTFSSTDGTKYDVLYKSGSVVGVRSSGGSKSYRAIYTNIYPKSASECLSDTTISFSNDGQLNIASPSLTTSNSTNSSSSSTISYGCTSYTEKTKCENNPDFACIWNETKYRNYCNVDKLQYVQCGSAFDIPSQVPGLTSFAINFLKIVTPIILIVTSIIALVKALMASKEDEIKKATSSLKRKIIAAFLVFLVIYIVQFVIMKVADSSESDDISSCLSCFINNDCSNNVYYKSHVGSKYYCTYVVNGTSFECPENK